MKLLEITVRRDRIIIRREAEERLTAEQKFHIILAVIACTAFLGFFIVSYDHIFPLRYKAPKGNETQIALPQPVEN